MNEAINAATHCFFSSMMAGYATNSTPYIVGSIDIVDPSTNLGLFSGKTLEQISAKYPDARVVTFEECERLREEAVIKTPWHITEDRFQYLKAVLPPCKWTNHGSEESFFLSERLTGSVVTWAVRLGNSFFELQDRSTLSHADVVRACSVTLAQETRAALQS